MFNPSREDVRRFFFETWRKYRTQAPLEGLEKTALEVALLHPEYHALLDSEDRNIDRDFVPKGGQLNPFLHLSCRCAVEGCACSPRNSAGCIVADLLAKREQRQVQEGIELTPRERNRGRYCGLRYPVARDTRGGSSATSSAVFSNPSKGACVRYLRQVSKKKRARLRARD